MQDLVINAFKIIKEIQENTRHALKELKAVKKVFESGNFIKVGTLIESVGFENALKALNLQKTHDELRAAYGRHITGLRMQFDKNFHSACDELNLKEVKGDSMSEFRIRGILSVKVNFKKNFAEIKTFARSKKLKSIDPVKVARESKHEVERLFQRPFEPKMFLTSLFEAYQKLKTESKKDVLLKDVHRILWFERQKDSFFDTSDRTKIVPYPLDEFSVDLGKLMESKVQGLDNGYICRISLGSSGVNIYGSNGNFNSYKFLEFVRGGNNA